MDTKQFFKDVYEDFFGVEKIKAENEKLAKELGLNQDFLSSSCLTATRNLNPLFIKSSTTSRISGIKRYML